MPPAMRVSRGQARQRPRGPISCGSKLSRPYHSRALNQSFQILAAPFAGLASTLAPAFVMPANAGIQTRRAQDRSRKLAPEYSGGGWTDARSPFPFRNRAFSKSCGSISSRAIGPVGVASAERGERQTRGAARPLAARRGEAGRPSARPRSRNLPARRAGSHAAAHWVLWRIGGSEVATKKEPYHGWSCVSTVCSRNYKQCIENAN
jgi:hypothetical protein